MQSVTKKGPVYVFQFFQKGSLFIRLFDRIQQRTNLALKVIYNLFTDLYLGCAGTQETKLSR